MPRRNMHSLPAREKETRSVTLTIRVRYAETDQMGVAHHANYLVWFEAARSEFCRAHGMDYTSMEAQGCFLPIIEVQCRYRASARYDEEIAVTTYVIERTRRTLRIGYRAQRGETLLAEGETLQMLVGRDGKPRTFPEEIARLFDPT